MVFHRFQLILTVFQQGLGLLPRNLTPSTTRHCAVDEVLGSSNRVDVPEEQVQAQEDQICCSETCGLQ